MIARFPTIYDVYSFTKGILISKVVLLSDLLTFYELETGLERRRREIIINGEKWQIKLTVKLNYLFPHDKFSSSFNWIIKSIIIIA